MKLHSIRRACATRLRHWRCSPVALPAAAQWTGKGEAGLAIANGNSDTKTANAKVAVGKKVDNWEHSAGLAGLYVRNDGDTTARRWAAFLQTPLQLRRRQYLLCSAVRATRRTASAASITRA